MEEDVLRWLRSFGYDASDAATARSVAAACKGNLRRVWEFLLSRAKPKAEKESIDRAVREWQAQQEADSSGPSKQQQLKALREDLQRLEEQAAALERTVASYQDQVHSQVQDVTEEAGEEQLHRHEQQDAGLQMLALQAYHARCLQLVPLLQARRARLQAIANAAKGRCDAQQHMPSPSPYRHHAAGSATARRTRPTALQERLQQLCAALQQELQQAVDAQCAEVPSDPLPSPHSMRPSSTGGTLEVSDFALDSPRRHLRLTAGSLVADHAASGQLLERAQRLLQEPPALLVRCMAGLAAAAAQEMDVLLQNDGYIVGGSNAAGSGGYQQQQQQGQQKQQVRHGSNGTEQTEAATSTPDPEQLVKQRQREHVRLFVESEAARVDAARAQAKLGALLASPGLRAFAQGDGPQLWLSVEGLRAEVAALESIRSELESEVASREEAEGQLQAKWGLIEAMVLQDRQLSRLLWQLADENLRLFQGLGTRHSTAEGMLKERLAPAGDMVAHTATGACGAVAQEADTFLRLPPSTLTPVPAADAPVSALAVVPSTLQRFQRSLQVLSEAGRPSTVVKGHVPGGGSGSAHDAALTAVLRAACEVDALAPLKCPAVATAGLAGQQQRAAQLQAQLGAFDALLAAASTSAAAASATAARLSTRTDEARDEDFERVLPALEAAAFKGQEARAFAEGPARRALLDWWTQPAQHLVPWHKYEGKDCSEWLVEVQALHGRLREMHMH